MGREFWLPGCDRMGRKSALPRHGGAERGIRSPECGGQGEVAWDQAEASRAVAALCAFLGWVDGWDGGQRLAGRGVAVPPLSLGWMYWQVPQFWSCHQSGAATTVTLGRDHKISAIVILNSFWTNSWKLKRTCTGEGIVSKSGFLIKCEFRFFSPFS